MAKRPDLPSRRSAPAPADASKVERRARTAPGRVPRTAGTATDARRTVDVRGWLGGVRLSGFTLIMLILVVLGVLTLMPTIGTYIDQRQRIAALEDAVSVAQDKVDALQQQKDRWSDPAYVLTQARERLYYYKPGEVVYLVDDDLDEQALPPEQAPVSDKVEQAGSDWMSRTLRSVVGAGLTQTAVVTPDGTQPTPDPSPTPSG